MGITAVRKGVRVRMVCFVQAQHGVHSMSGVLKRLRKTYMEHDQYVLLHLAYSSDQIPYCPTAVHIHKSAVSTFSEVRGEKLCTIIYLLFW